MNKSRMLERKYGKLQPIELLPDSHLRCRCDCGGEIICRAWNLYSRRIIECKDCVWRAKFKKKLVVRPELLAHLEPADQDRVIRAWRAHVKTCYLLGCWATPFAIFVTELLADPSWKQVEEPEPITYENRSFTQYKMPAKANI